jgi:DNA-binding GntR family transcriptional regulator
MAEQEANQGTENPQTSEQAGETTANGGGAGGQVFSQDEVHRIINARAERELKAILADVGLSDLGELKKLVQQKRAAEDAEKSELAKAQERASELEKRLAEAAEKQKALSTLSDITAKAARLGIVDPDAAYKLLNRSAIEYGDDGVPTNTEALLVALLKEKPYLAGSGSSAMNPGKTSDNQNDPILSAARKAAGLS